MKTKKTKVKKKKNKENLKEYQHSCFHSNHTYRQIVNKNPHDSLSYNHHFYLHQKSKLDGNRRQSQKVLNE